MFGFMPFMKEKKKNSLMFNFLFLSFTFLSGAKFRNTWEPAENFPGYLDDKNEELKKD